MVWPTSPCSWERSRCWPRSRASVRARWSGSAPRINSQRSASIRAICRTTRDARCCECSWRWRVVRLHLRLRLRGGAQPACGARADSAARHRQSVPVLGFLSITVTGFIALFPGSLLGLERASIFAIFTSQAWNMAFSFYQSLRTLPRDLEEATEAYRLSHWQRFRQPEVPAADDSAGVERDDELRRRLVLPRRQRGHRAC